MTNPPGMVVGVSGHFGDVLFSLWNYTEAEIEVNVEAEAVSPTEPLNNLFQATNIAVPSNATRSIAGHVDLGMPTYYPYRLPVGVYNLNVQANTDGIWYQVATRIEVSAPQPVPLNRVSDRLGTLTNPIVCW